MTAQATETLIYKGQELSLCETPLDDYLVSAGSGIAFESPSTALWRGYVGTWEVISDRLYLVALDGFQMLDGKFTEVGLADVFPDFPQGLFAHWYTGELRCPRGTLLRFTLPGAGFFEGRAGVCCAADGDEGRGCGSLGFLGFSTPPGTFRVWPVMMRFGFLRWLVEAS
jgi:hypothetical protein